MLRDVDKFMYLDGIIVSVPNTSTTNYTILKQWTLNYPQSFSYKDLLLHPKTKNMPDMTFVWNLKKINYF